MSFFADVVGCLQIENPLEKCAAAAALAAGSDADAGPAGDERYATSPDEPDPSPEVRCGRPERPP